MTALDNYSLAVTRQLEQIHSTQRAEIELAAALFAEALLNERWLYAFGTGHAHMMAEELFYRAGGLARAVPILDGKLMLHESATESTYVERRENYGAGLLENYPLAAGDVLLIASNSGRNPVPIDLALAACERGVKVVAITNLQHTKIWPSRHSTGKKLVDLADVAIDNCGVPGDACVELPGLPTLVGPTSTIAGAFIVNLLVVRAIENILAKGVVPEVYTSSNTGSDAHNERLLAKYKGRIRHL